MDKRNRLPNFSAYEESFLISLAEEHSHIIENKKTDAVAWEEKKKIWETIALEFEVRYGVKRVSKNLKNKYENLKRTTKKSLAEERKELYKTGGGQYKKNIDGNVERLAALMGRSATGCANNVDSDAVNASESEQFNCNLDESVQSAMMEDLTQTPEVLENINSQDNCNNWSSWNPAQLQNKKSGKLSSKCAEKKSKNSGTNPQHIFWENEELRSTEKHSWEAAKHIRETEKHSWEKTHAALKTQILELELEFKSQQLQ